MSKADQEHTDFYDLQFADSYIELTPEESMLVGILERACKDFHGESLLLTTSDPTYKRTLRTYIILQATRWFKSKSKKPWSFLYVCDQLNISPKWFLTTFDINL